MNHEPYPYGYIINKATRILQELLDIEEVCEGNDIGQSHWFCGRFPFATDLRDVHSSMVGWIAHMKVTDPKCNLCDLCACFEENCDCFTCNECEQKNLAENDKCRGCGSYQSTTESIVQRLTEVLEEVSDNNRLQTLIHRAQFREDLADALRIIQTHALDQ